MVQSLRFTALKFALNGGLVARGKILRIEWISQ